MTKEELENLLYKEFYDKNKKSIDISELNFTRFECDVIIDEMKVDGYLSQSQQTVSKDLVQMDQYVLGDLHQSDNNVLGNLYQSRQKVKGKVEQAEYGIDTEDMLEELRMIKKQLKNLNKKIKKVPTRR